MITSMQEEAIILKNVRRQIFNAKDNDEINNIYRQARIWNRFHHFIARACSYEKYLYLNKKFKQARWEAKGYSK